MIARRKIIAQWRVSQADPSGLTLWFDPMTEFPRLYELEPSWKPGVDTPVREDGRELDGLFPPSIKELSEGDSSNGTS